MNQAECKARALALADSAGTRMSYQGAKVALLEAQVYATLATIPDGQVYVDQLDD